MYINMSAAAGSTSYSASEDPLAIYSEKRNAPVVSDCSKFRLAVTRVDLNGCRNLPIFIPSIATGLDNLLDDPFKTNYQVSLSFQATTAKPLGAVPTYKPIPASQTFFLSITTYMPGGAVLTQAGYTTAVTVFTGASILSTPAALATMLETQLSTNGLDIVTNAMKVAVASPVTKQLLIYLDPSAAVSVAGYNFEISISTKPGGTLNVEDAAALMGMTDPFTPLKSVQGQVVTPLAASRDPSAGLQEYFSTQTVSLQWVPQAAGIPRPLGPNTSRGQSRSVAYWCFDYQWFVTILNNALATAWDLIFADIFAQSSGAIVCRTKAPFCVYNASSKTFTLYADACSTSGLGHTFSSSGSVSPGVQEFMKSIQMNELLENLMMFPAVYDRSGNATLRFNASPLVSTGVASASGTDSWVALSNDFSPVGSLWSPIGSLVFLTQYFPIRGEVTSAPTVFGGSDIGLSAAQGVGYESQQILSDVIPNITDASDWRSQTTLYSPTVLRWVDLPSGQLALDTVDFNLGWRNRITGEVVPLTLNPMASFSVKIMLRRKDIVD